MDAIRQDLRFAIRSLLRAPGVSALAVASLAIGIAANATVFSVLEAVEFPRLIYPDAGRLVFLESRNDARGLIGMPVSAPDALDIAAASRTLEHAALAADQRSILRAGGSVRRVSGRRVAPAFFQALGVSPVLGRVLGPGDGPDALVVSEGLWRGALGGDPSIAGRSVRLDGGTVTVVGVMPARFDADADFWVSLASTAGFARDDRQFTLFARLAPGAAFDAAAQEVIEISRRLSREHPGTNREWTTATVRLTRMHGRDTRGTFLLLQGAVACVLLIACANIANLLLARGARRRHEMAVRVSLGASRTRLIGALLIESALLSAAGGVLGVLLAMWGIRIARAYGGLPDVIEPTLNPVVLAFAAALAMVTGMVCGIVPALRASRVAPESVLRAVDGRTAAGGGRLRGGLVAAQVAGALVLTTCAALMLQTLANRARVDLGFDPGGAIRADLALPADRYQDPARVRGTTGAVLERLHADPDVVAAGASTWALPTGAGAQRQLTLPTRRDESLLGSIRRGIEAVTPAYFDALGAPLKQGRVFTAADREGSAPVAIVNEELARHLWPGRSPIGELLRLGTPGDAVPIVTVVGVVATVRRSTMHDAPIARVYVPYAQHPNAMMTIVVRTRGDLARAQRALQSAVEAADPLVLVEGLRSVETDIAQFVAPVRLIASVLAGFGAAGLLLAALGVFGTTSYSVSQRERELAVRAALGAGAVDIAGLVLGSALKITAAGIVAGLALSLAATRALAAFLYGVSPTDPATLAAVAAGLTAVSLAACYRPVRTAAVTDPAAVLRQ